MSTAFGITYDDVLTVLAQRFHFKGAAASDARANELFDILDMHKIERAALHGDDMDEQTDYALDEISDQLLAHFGVETVEAVLMAQADRIVKASSASAEDLAEAWGNEIDMDPLKSIFKNAAQVPFTPALTHEIERQLVAGGVLRPIAI